MHPTLCCKEIHVTPKIRVLPSGTLSKMLNVENFVTAAGRPEAVNKSVQTTTEFLSRRCRIRLAASPAHKQSSVRFGLSLYA